MSYEFPEHKAGLSLEHNEHLNYYETPEQFIAERDLADDFESPEAMQKAIATNSVWVLHWYPATPVSFYRVAAPTLEDVLRLAVSASGTTNG